MILCEWDASEGHPGQSCVHLYARILLTSFISVSIFSVWCYSSVSISMVQYQIKSEGHGWLGGACQYVWAGTAGTARLARHD
jgi:hypothetical protein